jgi:hypothetical protein
MNYEPMTLHRKLSHRIRAAKTHVFALQDLAREVGDSELSRRLANAREWIEAADRCVDDLAEKGKLR